MAWVEKWEGQADVHRHEMAHNVFPSPSADWVGGGDTLTGRPGESSEHPTLSDVVPNTPSIFTSRIGYVGTTLQPMNVFIFSIFILHTKACGLGD